MGVEFLFYSFVRFYVHIYERIASHWSKSARLARQLKEAHCYNEWQQAAMVLDDMEGKSAWKKEDACPYYNAVLINSVVEQLREYRQKKVVRKLFVPSRYM